MIFNVDGGTLEIRYYSLTGYGLRVLQYRIKRDIMVWDEKTSSYKMNTTTTNWKEFPFFSEEKGE